MHIAIDAHSVGTQLGGNETYATNLIEALAAIDQINRYTLFVTKPSAIERFANRWPNFTVKQTLPHTPIVRIPITLSAELRKNPVDVLHVQYTAPPLCPCPIVTTIHDLAFEHLPETFKRRSWMQLRITVRHTARRAAEIITVSEYSRQDICATYGISPERVTVTPEAASAEFVPITNEAALQNVRRKYGIERDYLLALGSIQPRKNLVRLIEAYAYLCESHPGRELPLLVIAGKRAWLENEVFRVAKTSAASRDVIFTGYVPDSALPALYSGALCFIYPSYFEGFGLPPLEAMKCGTPVIAGNRTSLPEVVGGAGLLIDPFDSRSIADGIAQLLFNPNVRADLGRRGLERAQLFDWQNTAKQTLQVYERAALNS
jgi:glycosyltransferase involved in cell wall biosynthesis